MAINNNEAIPVFDADKEQNTILQLFGPEAYAKAIAERGVSFIDGALLMVEHSEFDVKDADKKIALQKEIEKIKEQWRRWGEKNAYDKKSILALQKILNKVLTENIPEFQGRPGGKRFQKTKALMHAESFVNLKKRNEEISYIKYNDNVYQKRIDAPITAFTVSQTTEWLGILDEKKYRPKWFTKLAQWEQNYLREKVQAWVKNGKKGNLGDYLGVFPTTVRAYPGIRNAYTSTFITYENGVELSRTVKVRSGHVAPMEMKDKAARLEATKENIKQLMLANIKAQLAKGNNDVLICLQTLISPVGFSVFGKKVGSEDYKMNQVRRKAVKDLKEILGTEKGFKEFLLSNNIALNEGQRPKLTLLSSNHAVNKGRFIVWKHKENRDTFDELYKRATEKNNQKALRALEKIKEINGNAGRLSSLPTRLKNFFIFGMNHNAERAALEQIAIDALGGVRIGSCKSGKDREGGVSMHMAAMLLYYDTHKNTFPPLPQRLKKVSKKVSKDDKANRSVYESLVAKQLMNGHDTRIANENASGSFGIKDVAQFLGNRVLDQAKNIIKEKMPEMEKDMSAKTIARRSDTIANLNKLSTPFFISVARIKVWHRAKKLRKIEVPLFPIIESQAAPYVEEKVDSNVGISASLTPANVEAQNIPTVSQQVELDDEPEPLEEPPPPPLPSDILDEDMEERMSKINQNIVEQGKALVELNDLRFGGNEKKFAILHLLVILKELPKTKTVLARLEIQSKIVKAIYDEMIAENKLVAIASKVEPVQSIEKMLKMILKERKDILDSVKYNPESREYIGLDQYEEDANKFLKEKIEENLAEIENKDYAVKEKKLSDKEQKALIEEKAIATIENSILYKAGNLMRPFKEYEFSGASKGGKQEKAQYTAFYMDNNGKEWHIKMSKKHLADNVAEVVTSSLLVNLIGETQAVPYDFIESNDGQMYLKSEKRSNFESLEDRMKRTGGKGHLWLFSNPVFDWNKQRIHKNIVKEEKHESDLIAMKEKSNENQELKRQCAKILAGSLLVLDSDTQVGNMSFYTKDGKTQMAKFDDGWGLAGICLDGNKRVKLFEEIEYHGIRGTHEGEFLPTNHWVDYPYVLHSQEFVDALQDVAMKMKAVKPDDDNNIVNKALGKIDAAYSMKVEDKEEEKVRVQILRLKAYIEFAAHIGVYNINERAEQLTKLETGSAGKTAIMLMNEANAVRSYVHKKLSARLNDRANSMLLLSKTLNIAIKMKSYKKIKAKDKLSTSKALLNDLETVYKTLHDIYGAEKLDTLTLKEIFPRFQDAPPPFVSKIRRKFLEEVLKSINEEDRNSAVYIYFSKIKILADHKAKQKHKAKKLKAKSKGKFKKAKFVEQPIPAKIATPEVPSPSSVASVSIISTPKVPPPPPPIVPSFATKPQSPTVISNLSLQFSAAEQKAFNEDPIMNTHATLELQGDHPKLIGKPPHHNPVAVLKECADSKNQKYNALAASTFTLQISPRLTQEKQMEQIKKCLAVPMGEQITVLRIGAEEYTGDKLRDFKEKQGITHGIEPKKQHPGSHPSG